MEPGEIHVYDVDIPPELRSEIEQLLARWGYVIRRTGHEIYIHQEIFQK
jgi:hypothetical protein